MGAAIKTIMTCALCKVEKNIREFSYANIWKLKEKRACKECVRHNKKKRFDSVKKKIGNLTGSQYVTLELRGEND